MRTSKFFALGVIFLTVVSFQSIVAGSKEQVSNTPENPNYVVIGAFAIQKNAANFAAEAVKESHNAKFEINTNRNLYYVYVMTTDDHGVAIAEALRLRKESPYFDTWVYNGLLGVAGTNVKGTDINPESKHAIETVTKQDVAIVAVTTTNTAPDTDTVLTDAAPIVEEKEPEILGDAEGKNFFFKIYRVEDNVQVEGDVTVTDAERSRKIGTYVGNKQIRITDPKSKEGKISLGCEIFGYRKVLRDLNYKSPEGDDIKTDENNFVVVPFELVRLQKGDVAVMYNVFFFKDAAIMRPESRSEATSLLTMLKENEKYRIRIHGHANGGAHGRIISLNEGNEDYFALNDTKDGLGSAKELSQARAEVVRNFLVSNGIDTKRMEIKAWGGKKPLYDKHSPQAQSNVRVEIEIIEH
jgi:outer membrane protein OmpA-like peptidoglycan-associated protein